MSTKRDCKRNEENQGNEPDGNLPPAILVLILISTLLGGLFLGIAISGAFIK